MELLPRGRAGHSGLMPANLTTLAHFSVSAATKLPKSEGEPAITVPPRSASRALSWGSARPALISLLSLSTISAVVAFGAPMPNQTVASYPATKSPTVGTSGSASERPRRGHRQRTHFAAFDGRDRLGNTPAPVHPSGR